LNKPEWTPQIIPIPAFLFFVLALPAFPQNSESLQNITKSKNTKYQIHNENILLNMIDTIAAAATIILQLGLSCMATATV
jgi:hypothetical protein